MLAGAAAKSASARSGPIASVQARPAAAGPSSHHVRHLVTRPVTANSDREHDGELREQQVREHDRHGAGRDQLAAARQGRRDELAGPPWRRARLRGQLGRHAL